MYLWRGLKPQSIVAAFNALNERPPAQVDGGGGVKAAPTAASNSQTVQANKNAPAGRQGQTLRK